MLHYWLAAVVLTQTAQAVPPTGRTSSNVLDDFLSVPSSVLGAVGFALGSAEEGRARVVKVTDLPHGYLEIEPGTNEWSQVALFIGPKGEHVLALSGPAGCEPPVHFLAFFHGTWVDITSGVLAEVGIDRFRKRVRAAHAKEGLGWVQEDGVCEQACGHFFFELPRVGTSIAVSEAVHPRVPVDRLVTVGFLDWKAGHFFLREVPDYGSSRVPARRPEAPGDAVDELAEDDVRDVPKLVALLQASLSRMRSSDDVREVEPASRLIGFLGATGTTSLDVIALLASIPSLELRPYENGDFSVSFAALDALAKMGPGGLDAILQIMNERLDRLSKGHGGHANAALVVRGLLAVRTLGPEGSAAVPAVIRAAQLLEQEHAWREAFRTLFALVPGSDLLVYQTVFGPQAPIPGGPARPSTELSEEGKRDVRLLLVRLPPARRGIAGQEANFHLARGR